MMPEKNISRRSFVGGSIGLYMAGPYLFKGLAEAQNVQDQLMPARKSLPNPYIENGKPIVVIVRGSVFSTMLAKGMEVLGGFSRFGTGRSVIVKPNFVFDKVTKYPTTTDENSVLTTVEFLRREGFHDITVADRRGKKEKGRAGGKFEWSGLNDMAERGGFKTDSLLDDNIAETVIVKDERWTQMPSYGVIKKIYDAGLIINMPTLKRHTQTNFTCGLKNMMGVLDVPTTENMHLWGEANRTRYQATSPQDVTRRLCLAIAEAASAVLPELTVIDARTILCKGHIDIGPGEPRDANRLIISGDTVAADVVAANLLKELYEPYEVGFTKDTFEHASVLGIGNCDLGNVIIKQVDA